MILETCEKNNSFTVDMTASNETYLDNKIAQNLRFTLVIIETGAGIIKINDKAFSFISPAIICLNETEHLVIEKSLNCRLKVIYFHPNILNCDFDFKNIRSLPQDSNITMIQDAYFTKYFINRDIKYHGIISIGPATYARFRTLSQNLIDELNMQKNSFWPCRSRSFLLEMLYLIDNIFLNLDNAETDEVSKEVDNDIYPILLYLYNNYNKKITISDLSKEFGINRTSLSQKFNKYTKDSVIVYLNKLRIKMASIMLRDTRIPISEVMERTGFTDPSHFLRTFKKYIDMSPKQYRDKYCWVD